MRDVYCRRCGEPWDIDTFRDVVAEHNELHPQDDLEFTEVYRDFLRYGCKVVTGKFCEVTLDDETSAVIAMVGDLMGDDVDGACAEFEDLEAMGLLP